MTAPSSSPPTSSRRPAAPRPRGAARRDALLDATLRVVGEHGADAVTHRRVAELAGLPLASTTYWFTSKEHLLTAALERAAALDLERLDAAAQALGSRRVDARAIVGVILETVEPGAGRGQLLAAYTLLLEAARRPALRELARRWAAGYLLVVGDLCARAGSRRPVDDARLIMAATDGLTVDTLSVGTSCGPAERAELERLAVTLIGAS